MNSPLENRRDFLKSSSTAAALTFAAPALLMRDRAFAANTDTIRIGLVGCGGRGTGAAGNALEADKNLVLVAMGDAFDDQLKQSHSSLDKQFPGRVQVEPSKRFVGLDAYQKVIDAGVDVVLLASPPGFRPTHLRYAVEKKKHIFCEKPMATDSAGIRHVMESVRMSKEAKLNIVAGYCWRYSLPRREFFKRINEGEIGEVLAMYGTYLTGPVKPMQAPSQRKDGVGDLEWQMRNWMNFTWLAGDGFVEQCIHTVDKMMWAFGDKPPAKVVANGGRVHPNYEGNIFDHMTATYEWANGARGVIAQRQIANCYSDNSDYVLGGKGKGWNGWSNAYFKNADGSNGWRYRGENPDMYVVEHQHLYRAIRAGEFHNDGDRMVNSTLAGIMGRLSAYTGQEVTWEQALNSKIQLVPDNMSWDMKLPIEPLPVPGKTKLS
ncbi:MAG: Inositol 2-dehydrogenase/D-chiro-inositol 3-dehydrogenase [Verrucomicrobiota bacterium]|jgi:predicted dehydrogenase|nr:Gfo/Idh/MocA family oxidoreductase [Verrucomicrobiota bacterium]